MKFRDFILSMVSDPEGTGISSKRVVGVVGFLAILVIAAVDLFTQYSVSEFIFDGLMYIVIACFFSNAIESFSKRTGQASGTRISIDEVKNIDVKPPVTPAPKKQDIAEINQTVEQQLSNIELEPNEIIG
jgi:hypothetical protein